MFVSPCLLSVSHSGAKLWTEGSSLVNPSLGMCLQLWWKSFGVSVIISTNALSPLLFLLHLSLPTASRSFRNLSYKRIRMNWSQAYVRGRGKDGRGKLIQRLIQPVKTSLVCSHCYRDEIF